MHLSLIWMTIRLEWTDCHTFVSVLFVWHKGLGALTAILLFHIDWVFQMSAIPVCLACRFTWIYYQFCLGRKLSCKIMIQDAYAACCNLNLILTYFLISKWTEMRLHIDPVLAPSYVYLHKFICLFDEATRTVQVRMMAALCKVLPVLILFFLPSIWSK